MSIVNKALRQLTQEYHRGELSFEEYRKQRRRLIDSLTGELNINDEVPSENLDDTKPRLRIPPQRSGQRTRGGLLRLMLGFLVLAGLAGVMWWLIASGKLGDLSSLSEWW